MRDNSLLKIGRFLKRVLVYEPPDEPSRFVLKEREPLNGHAGLDASAGPALDQLEAKLRYARRLAAVLEKARETLANGEGIRRGGIIDAEYKALVEQSRGLEPVLASYDSQAADMAGRSVSTSLEENRRIITAIYRLPENKDIVVRELTMGTTPPLKAMLVFMEGLANGDTISTMILQPLMLFARKTRRVDREAVVRQVMEELLPGKQVQAVQSYAELETAVNGGDTAVFIDGAAEAIIVGTKGWEHRGVERPMTEQSVRGSQAAFAENLRVNTGLIRAMLRSSDLVTEMVTVGARSRVNCAIMYLESVASPELVTEVKRRVRGISTDYVDDSGLLEQFIEDKFILPLPQTLQTERPDRVAAHLSEGRIALVMENSPFVLVMPVSFFTFFHSGEDFSLRAVPANFLRLLRLFGALVSTIMPSFYIAITYFHQEALPTELVLAIAGAREEVPFPAILEIVMMELSFELIREAGIRIPGILGSTIGIVGAIILGQAAVSARIVSPIIVIIVAITGLASSIIPEFRMAFFSRLSRFGLLVLSAMTGLVGLATGLLTLTVALCSFKSFGVPYMAPVAPKTVATLDVVIRGSAERIELRPDSLAVGDKTRQPPISRKWAQQPPAGEEDGR